MIYYHKIPIFYPHSNIFNGILMGFNGILMGTFPCEQKKYKKNIYQGQKKNGTLAPGWRRTSAAPRTPTWRSTSTTWRRRGDVTKRAGVAVCAIYPWFSHGSPTQKVGKWWDNDQLKKWEIWENDGFTNLKSGKIYGTMMENGNIIDCNWVIFPLGFT